LPDNKHARAEVMDETKKEIEVVIWHDKSVKIETEMKLIKAITEQGYEVKNMTITNEYEER
jgi:biopolymer transport protein ExbD